MPHWQDNITIILVATRKAGNIGSVARAMDNLGFSRLGLVNPREPVNDECRKMAAGSFAVVQRANLFATFEDAVADAHLVVATTSNRGRRARRRHETPAEMACRIRATAAGRKVALVFGPERRGLSEHQLARCHHLVSIPSSVEAPTFNVAQAVLLFCYELFAGGSSEQVLAPALARQKQREEMFQHMQSVLLEIGFLSQSNPDHIMDSIRHFLGRAELTPRDLKILRGIMSRIKWYVDEGRKLEAGKARKP